MGKKISCRSQSKYPLQKNPIIPFFLPELLVRQPLQQMIWLLLLFSATTTALLLTCGCCPCKKVMSLICFTQLIPLFAEEKSSREARSSQERGKIGCPNSDWNHKHHGEEWHCGS